jgi:hypothetical protein
VQFALTVPYGQDRLIPIWVATLALRQKSRTDKFRTVAEMLAFFKLAPDGYHYERIVQSFKRIFAATILFGTEDQPDGGTRAYSRKRRFRQTILAWLRQVKAFWPNCPATISADGHVLVVGSSRNSPAIRRGGRI